MKNPNNYIFKRPKIWVLPILGKVFVGLKRELDELHAGLGQHIKEKEILNTQQKYGVKTAWKETEKQNNSKKVTVFFAGEEKGGRSPSPWLLQYSHVLVGGLSYLNSTTKNKNIVIAVFPGWDQTLVNNWTKLCREYIARDKYYIHTLLYFGSNG